MISCKTTPVPTVIVMFASGFAILVALLCMLMRLTAARAAPAIPTILAQNSPAKPASYQDMALIPEATFTFRDGEQRQQVHVKSFYLDLYEETVGEFKAFLAATGYR